ncbi:hypothetical protein AWB82_05858 [Caballeronia glebae]|uniref:Uncharacterized protein n=1 Tax=Caballeronia glebae TaxID=1777143 RepID=A0A158CUZ3_9BURK|nr:hypothetical protein AWB82_05858 [Caballeronia glebae]
MPLSEPRHEPAFRKSGTRCRACHPLRVCRARRARRVPRRMRRLGFQRYFRPRRDHPDHEKAHVSGLDVGVARRRSEFGRSHLRHEFERASVCGVGAQGIFARRGARSIWRAASVPDAGVSHGRRRCGRHAERQSRARRERRPLDGRPHEFRRHARLDQLRSQRGEQSRQCADHRARSARGLRLARGAGGGVGHQED